MEPFPLVGRYGLAEPDQVDTGWMRAARRGPSTVGEVLARGVAAMEAEDQAEAYSRDPVAYVAAQRRPTLLRRLLGRC